MEEVEEILKKNILGTCNPVNYWTIIKMYL